MGTDALAELIEGGAAMLGASRDGDLRPEAFRVWGARIVDAERVRILASADAERSFRDLCDGAPVAVTFTDIQTFRSIQAKGVVEGGVEPAGPSDLALLQLYDEAFGTALASIGHPRTLADRIRPLAVFAVTYRIAALFDQTPGRGAGSPVAPATP
jgi:hypothetical protein